jgi:hypothetical protein
LRNEAEKVRTLLIYLKCYTQGLFLSPDCVKYSVIYFVFPLRSEKHTVIINLHTTKWRHPFAAGPGRGNYILVGLFIKPSHFSVCAVENARQHCACAASSALQHARRLLLYLLCHLALLFTTFWGAFGNLSQQGGR